MTCGSEEERKDEPALNRRKRARAEKKITETEMAIRKSAPNIWEKAGMKEKTSAKTMAKTNWS